MLKIARQMPKTLGLLLAGIVLVIVCLAFFWETVWQFFRDIFTAFQSIETAREYIAGYGALAPIVSALLMIFQSVIAPLPAFLLTIANGALFGFWWGMLLSWSSAMLGAALCFYITRWLGAKHITRIIRTSIVERTNLFFEKYGSYAILIARLIPVISFDAVSYVAGLTRMRFLGFWVATGIGQLPATVVYSYLGESISGNMKLLLWGFGIAISISIVIYLVRNR